MPVRSGEYIRLGKGKMCSVLPLSEPAKILWKGFVALTRARDSSISQVKVKVKVKFYAGQQPACIKERPNSQR
eukprot:314764-Pelagomonas_calceolata.AAC.1